MASERQKRASCSVLFCTRQVKCKYMITHLILFCCSLYIFIILQIKYHISILGFILIKKYAWISQVFLWTLMDTHWWVLSDPCTGVLSAQSWHATFAQDVWLFPIDLWLPSNEGGFVSSVKWVHGRFCWWSSGFDISWLITLISTESNVWFMS